METNENSFDADDDAACQIVHPGEIGRAETVASEQKLLYPGQLLRSLPQAALSAVSGADTVPLAPQEAKQVFTTWLSEQHGIVPFNDLNTPIVFETPLFRGTALLLLRNLPNTPHGVFEGKRRQMVLTLQGQFKQPDIAFDSLSFGSDFERALKLPTSPLLNQAVSWLAAKMGGGVSVHVGGKRPHILAPLISAAQVVNVAQPGQQPDIRAPHEDMRLFDTGLVSRWTGAPMSSRQRRAHFSSAGHRRGHCFDRDHVWTFQMYEHLMDYSTFLLNLPFFRVDMVQVFDGQPLQLMAQDMATGDTMFHLTLWHRRMLQHAANQSPSVAAAAAAAEDDDATNTSG